MADWMMDTFFIFSGLALVAFLAAWKAGPLPGARQGRRGSRCSSRRRTTTRPTGRSTRRSGPMAMPSGDSPAKAQQYYDYLQAHQQTMHAAATWHVDWLSLAWLWGFLVALALIDPLVGLAVPHDPRRRRHLPGRQLRRLHDGARRPGDALLRPPDGDHHRVRRRADRRPPRLGAEVLMAATEAAPSACRTSPARR